jgi:hypothetical protein
MDAMEGSCSTHERLGIYTELWSKNKERSDHSEDMCIVGTLVIRTILEK